MPDIVYIDDDPDALTPLAGEARDRLQYFQFVAENSNPDAFEAAKVAKIWLFDFFLVGNNNGEGRDENGLSLFQKWKAMQAARPTTVVVSSDFESAVGEPLGPVERRHVIAQRHGVEWVGEKSADEAKVRETLRQLVELADAATAISGNLRPADDGTYDAERLCFEVLGAPRDADWANSAQRQIDRARPPREVPTVSEPATARSIIGWLLTHVLPYPSFLLTDAQAAVRLEMTPASFRSIAKVVESDLKKEGYRKVFDTCRYRGPLTTFHGRRWWRAAIDDLAWHLSQDENGFRPALEMLAGEATIDWLEQLEPVLLSNSNLVETDDFAEAKDCVRVTDEDFPANVDPAWVRIEAAREDRHLAAKVVYEDRELLSPTE